MLDAALGERGSLRMQLLRWLAPPVLTVILLSSGITYALALKFASEAYDIGLYDEALSLAELVRFEPGGLASVALPREAQQMIESDPFDRIYYRVFLPGGETIAGRRDLPVPLEAPSPEQPTRYYDATIEGRPVRIGAFAIFDSDGSTRATALVAETLKKRERLLRSVMLTVLVPLVSLSLLVAGIVWYGIRRGLLPLQQLAATVGDRGMGDLKPIGGPGIPQEARPLVRAIDDLMGRLTVALDAQQRFLSEAAHELRTPLAGLSAQAERALASEDIPTVKGALVQLQVAAQRVARLVNQLLALARAEPGSARSRNFGAVDLESFARRVCMQWVPQALERDIDLGFVGAPEPVSVLGDEHLLEDLLNNLISNALCHGARPGGNVTVSVQASPPMLCVEDDGVGIPPEERARVFERFHRVPGSSPGGSGLGLSIVRQIACAHGAEAFVDPEPRHGGAMFRVVFRAPDSKATRTTL